MAPISYKLFNYLVPAYKVHITKLHHYHNFITMYFHINIYRKLWVAGCTVMAILAFYLTILTDTTPSASLALFFYLIFATFAIYHSLRWITLWNIRKKAKRKDLLDTLLFSDLAVKQRLKDIIEAIVIIAIFGWVWLPGLFSAFSYLETQGARYLLDNINYRDQWSTLIDADHLSEVPVEFGGIPRPDLLESSLSPFPSAHRPQEMKKLFVPFLNGMFLFLTLHIGCQICIPAVVNAMLYREQREGFRYVFVQMIKATAFTVLLQIVSRDVFLQDVSRMVSTSTLFVGMMSFFLVQQLMPPPSIEKQREDREVAR